MLYGYCTHSASQHYEKYQRELDDCSQDLRKNPERVLAEVERERFKILNEQLQADPEQSEELVSPIDRYDETTSHKTLGVALFASDCGLSGSFLDQQRACFVCLGPRYAAGWFREYKNDHQLKLTEWKKARYKHLQARDKVVPHTELVSEYSNGKRGDGRRLENRGHELID